MNIVEATKLAVKEDKAISSYKGSFLTVSIVPNGPLGLWMIIDSDNEVAVSPKGWPARWEPKTSDFLNEDWQVVDYDKNAIKNAIEGVS